MGNIVHTTPSGYTVTYELDYLGRVSYVVCLPEGTQWDTYHYMDAAIEAADALELFGILKP